MFNLFNGSKKITEKLYEQNLELAVKNKTLSLLEKLYKKSVLNLTPEEMGGEIASTICKDLNLEFTGIYTFNREGDSFAPLAFSKSERLKKTLDKLGFLFSEIKITNVSKNEFLRQVVYDKIDNITNDLQTIWKDFVKFEHLKQVKKESHIVTILVEPLITDREAFGVLLLGFNRDYGTLNAFEKISIRSFINVISLSIDKAYLYKNLQDSYEITKRAYVIEKKAKEELEKIDKFKDQFLMTTQHNLRTPLTSMMGYSDLLISGTFGKQNKKTMEVIKKFQLLTQGMIKMINDFLNMAQFQLGESVVSLSPNIDIMSILNDIIIELQFKADSRGVYLKLESNEDISKIKADREKLKAALFNIVDNAIKYTEKGGVSIKIKNQISNIKNGENRKVMIEVRDTGIGILPGEAKKLFETQFERIEQAKKLSSVGSGIGLYLAGQIIDAHKGKVWIESEGLGKGSTFFIELPIG